MAKLRRDGRERPEVDHVGGADRDDLRDASLRGRGQACGPGRQHAADQFVGQFGGGDVQDAGDQPVANQPFHRLSAAAGGVKHEHFVAGLFEDRAGLIDTGRGDAEHGGGDQRPVVALAAVAAAMVRSMPAMAAAALPRMMRLMRLSPAISTTELSIRMSLSPTKARTSPEASVLTMTLGTPIGSCRMAAVPMVVPAEPPSPSTPCSRPAA